MTTREFLRSKKNVYFTSSDLEDTLVDLLDEWRRQPCGKLQPLYDKIVVEPIEGDMVLGSGLSLPETAREKPMKGIVIAVGPGKGEKYPSDLSVNIGDVVLYAKHAGVEVSLEEKDYLIMREVDIFAII